MGFMVILRMHIDLGRVLVKAPGWRIDSGGKLLIDANAPVFEIDALNRLIGRKGFRLEKDSIDRWGILEGSSLLRKFPSISSLH